MQYPSGRFPICQWRMPRTPPASPRPPSHPDPHHTPTPTTPRPPTPTTPLRHRRLVHLQYADCLQHSHQEAPAWKLIFSVTDHLWFTGPQCSPVSDGFTTDPLPLTPHVQSSLWFTTYPLPLTPHVQSSLWFTTDPLPLTPHVQSQVSDLPQTLYLWLHMYTVKSLIYHRPSTSDSTCTESSLWFTTDPLPLTPHVHSQVSDLPQTLYLWLHMYRVKSLIYHIPSTSDSTCTESSLWFTTDPLPLTPHVQSQVSDLPQTLYLWLHMYRVKSLIYHRPSTSDSTCTESSLWFTTDPLPLTPHVHSQVSDLPHTLYLWLHMYRVKSLIYHIPSTSDSTCTQSSLWFTTDPLPLTPHVQSQVSDLPHTLYLWLHMYTVKSLIYHRPSTSDSTCTESSVWFTTDPLPLTPHVQSQVSDLPQTLYLWLHMYRVKSLIYHRPSTSDSTCTESSLWFTTDPLPLTPHVQSQVSDLPQTLYLWLHMYRVKSLIYHRPSTSDSTCTQTSLWFTTDPLPLTPHVQSQVSDLPQTLYLWLHMYRVKSLIYHRPSTSDSTCTESSLWFTTDPLPLTPHVQSQVSDLPQTLYLWLHMYRVKSLIYHRPSTSDSTCTESSLWFTTDPLPLTPHVQSQVSDLPQTLYLWLHMYRVKSLIYHRPSTSDSTCTESSLWFTTDPLPLTPHVQSQVSDLPQTLYLWLHMYTVKSLIYHRPSTSDSTCTQTSLWFTTDPLPLTPHVQSQVSDLPQTLYLWLHMYRVKSLIYHRPSTSDSTCTESSLWFTTDPLPLTPHVQSQVSDLPQTLYLWLHMYTVKSLIYHRPSTSDSTCTQTSLWFTTDPLPLTPHVQSQVSDLPHTLYLWLHMYTVKSLIYHRPSTSDSTCTESSLWFTTDPLPLTPHVQSQVSDLPQTLYLWLHMYRVKSLIYHIPSTSDSTCTQSSLWFTTDPLPLTPHVQSQVSDLPQTLYLWLHMYRVKSLIYHRPSTSDSTCTESSLWFTTDPLPLTPHVQSSLWFTTYPLPLTPHVQSQVWFTTYPLPLTPHVQSSLWFTTDRLPLTPHVQSQVSDLPQTLYLWLHMYRVKSLIYHRPSTSDPTCTESSLWFTTDPLPLTPHVQSQVSDLPQTLYLWLHMYTVKSLIYHRPSTSDSTCTQSSLWFTTDPLPLTPHVHSQVSDLPQTLYLWLHMYRVKSLIYHRPSTSDSTCTQTSLWFTTDPLPLTPHVQSQVSDLPQTLYLWLHMYTDKSLIYHRPSTSDSTCTESSLWFTTDPLPLTPHVQSQVSDLPQTLYLWLHMYTDKSLIYHRPSTSDSTCTVDCSTIKCKKSHKCKPPTYVKKFHTCNNERPM